MYQKNHLNAFEKSLASNKVNINIEPVTRLFFYSLGIYIPIKSVDNFKKRFIASFCILKRIKKKSYSPA